MPWRRTRDPYRIWVSETMLQQTQVATATPFYQRFLRRFPTLRALAGSREADVLATWSGLGYYRRARHLHEAARLVVRDHGGRVPHDPDAFARLPGVGRYTKGAVMSLAFDHALPVLDGNVARVLSRVHALPVSIRDPRGARALWEIAESIMPARAPGEWNQALMELGAVLCTPRSPRCAECPFARIAGRTQRAVRKRIRSRRRVVRRTRRRSCSSLAASRCSWRGGAARCWAACGSRRASSWRTAPRRRRRSRRSCGAWASRPLRAHRNDAAAPYHPPRDRGGAMARGATRRDPQARGAQVRGSRRAASP
jgi:A/G-specific adenine glycosylase